MQVTKDLQRVLESTKLWYHQIELAPGIVTPGNNDSPKFLRMLDLPADLTGKRVLDLGTRDGYFAFEAEKRGAAEVVAVDYVPATSTGFAAVAAFFDSKVRFIHENIMNLSPKSLGTFDIVLFLGLLYHLRDPMASLDLIRGLCKDKLYLETQTLDRAFMVPGGGTAAMADVSPVLVEQPIMQFCPRNSLNNDPTNYWVPNMRCVELMLEEADFRITRKIAVDCRGVFEAVVGNDEEIRYNRDIARGNAMPQMGP